MRDAYMHLPLTNNICGNCCKLHSDHAGNKCIFEPTEFTPAPCIFCNTTQHMPVTTACVEGIRYYLCDGCANFYAISNHINVYVIHPKYRMLIQRFLNKDISIAEWVASDEY